MTGGNIFLVLCDKTLLKEARTIRKWIAESGHYNIQTIKQIPLVTTHQQFEDKLDHLLTSWSEAVIVLTSASFTAYIDEGKTYNLPELLLENHHQNQRVLKDFFTKDSKQIKSKIIAITVNDNDGGPLPQCLSHVQPVIKDANKEAFVDTISRILTWISNSWRPGNSWKWKRAILFL